MPIPYLLTTLLYTFVAVFAAADASLVSLGIFSAFPALHWVRVHFITLGILSQVVFGVLPWLIASLSKRPRPAMRWDIWLTLNVGFIALIAGFSGMNQPIIFTGGALVFLSAALLFMHLWTMRGGDAPASLKFYGTGLFYLLVGIIIGTGIYLNWSGPLQIKIPIETHIHANSWGFMSLVFAGLLVDFVPLITGHPLGSAKNMSRVYWGMTSGAFGLVLGPWLGGSKPPLLLGLILHVSSTVWMLVMTVQAFKAGGKLNSPGAWHLVSAYVWIIAPIMAAPLIMLGVVPAGPIESTAPQALIYGWVLQYGISLIPYIARRFLLREANPQLGGSWVSVAAATLGSILVWVSIFIVPARGVLYGIGFAFYVIALIQPLREFTEIARTSLLKHELA